MTGIVLLFWVSTILASGAYSGPDIVNTFDIIPEVTEG
jgi:hypothetical protein